MLVVLVLSVAVAIRVLRDGAISTGAEEDIPQTSTPPSSAEADSPQADRVPPTGASPPTAAAPPRHDSFDEDHGPSLLQLDLHRTEDRPTATSAKPFHFASKGKACCDCWQRVAGARASVGGYLCSYGECMEDPDYKQQKWCWSSTPDHTPEKAGKEVFEYKPYAGSMENVVARPPDDKPPKYEKRIDPNFSAVDSSKESDPTRAGWMNCGGDEFKSGGCDDPSGRPEHPVLPNVPIGMNLAAGASLFQVVRENGEIGWAGPDPDVGAPTVSGRDADVGAAIGGGSAATRTLEQRLEEDQDWADHRWDWQED